MVCDHVCGCHREKKRKAGVDRGRRPARKKAVQPLTERSFNKENTLSPPHPQNNKPGSVDKH